MRASSGQDLIQAPHAKQSATRFLFFMIPSMALQGLSFIHVPQLVQRFSFFLMAARLMYSKNQVIRPAGQRNWQNGLKYTRLASVTSDIMIMICVVRCQWKSSKGLKRS